MSIIGELVSKSLRYIILLYNRPSPKFNSKNILSYAIFWSDAPQIPI